MATISDVIESFIKELIRQSQGHPVEIQRNEIAKHFDCAPSQINYVLTTRFSTQHGYYIESQRGGGGFIKIMRLKADRSRPLYQILMEEIGSETTKTQASRVIQALEEQKLISERESLLMKAATSDVVLASPINNRDQLRARVLKGMISVLLH
ncbi:MAG: CtsR family transcriptional regulator [Bacillota bacterium]|nr:CtsR family transcriptional regulator [Bacillota bacterium]MDW7677130.1 CtsR family transcriptional regulator [Bacillota bacterium]